jgi:hypothetical protein
MYLLAAFDPQAPLLGPRSYVPFTEQIAEATCHSWNRSWNANIFGEQCVAKLDSPKSHTIQGAHTPKSRMIMNQKVCHKETDFMPRLYSVVDRSKIITIVFWHLSEFINMSDYVKLQPTCIHGYGVLADPWNFPASTVAVSGNFFRVGYNSVLHNQPVYGLPSRQRIGPLATTPLILLPRLFFTYIIS